MKKLVEQLINAGYLETSEIIDAFESIDRKHFLIPLASGRHEDDEPISIGFGQTVAQPSTIAFMFELLQPREGDRVLDVGSGSGYTMALFSYIVGKKGKTFGIEIIDELKEFGETNVKNHYPFVEQGIAEFRVGDGSQGLKDEAPFDVIHVGASTGEVPEELIEQLADGGRMIVPIGEYCHEIYLFKKDKNGQISKEKYPGFAFVPLVSKK